MSACPVNNFTDFDIHFDKLVHLGTVYVKCSSEGCTLKITITGGKIVATVVSMTSIEGFLVYLKETRKNSFFLSPSRGVTSAMLVVSLVLMPNCFFPMHFSL